MYSKIHICIPCEILPSLRHGGGGVTLYSLILGFLQNNCSLTILCFENIDKSTNKDHADLVNLGVTIIYKKISISKKNNFINSMFPLFSKTFPYSNYSSMILKMIDDICPDIIFCYHWDSVSSVYAIKKYPLICFVGDPSHLPILFRKQFSFRYSKRFKILRYLSLLYFNLITTKFHKIFMKKLLENTRICGAFAHHHSLDLLNLGLNNVSYLQTPVPNENDLSFRKQASFRILLVGHLRGIATLSGIEYFIDKIYPILVLNLGETNFEVHIVGGFFETLPDKLKLSLTKSNIFIKGQVNPINDEINSADIFLVPTPIELGIRVRIITGFSFGSLIVAHTANKAGIPELEHGHNCLLSDNPKGLAQNIIDVYNNKFDTFNIRFKSRQTYEQYFTPKVSSNKILDLLK